MGIPSELGRLEMLIIFLLKGDSEETEENARSFFAKNEVNSIYMLDTSDPEFIFNYISYVVDAYNVYML